MYLHDAEASCSNMRHVQTIHHHTIRCCHGDQPLFESSEVGDELWREAQAFRVDSISDSCQQLMIVSVSHGSVQLTLTAATHTTERGEDWVRGELGERLDRP